MANAPTAVVWTLTAPSVVSGRKEYRVLIFDKYVVVGWGVMGETIQYKMHTMPSPDQAQAYALQLTSQKEKKGYSLYRGPLQSQLSAEHWYANLPGYSHIRGGSPFFDSEFRVIFTGGVEL